MNILFCILTGLDFKDTRNVAIKNTWVKKIPEKCDYIFLEGKSDSNRNVIGYDTPEGHFTSWMKLKEFFKNFSFLKYDWVFLSDSDCFVYPNKVKDFLVDYNISSPICICRIMEVQNNEYTNCQGDTKGNYLKLRWDDPNNCGFFAQSGGAGLALNKKALLKLQNYLIKLQSNVMSIHYDLSLSLWLNECDIPFLHTRKLRPEPESKLKNMTDYFDDDVLTHHYLKEKDFYEIFERKYSI